MCLFHLTAIATTVNTNTKKLLIINNIRIFLASYNLRLADIEAFVTSHGESLLSFSMQI